MRVPIPKATLGKRAVRRSKRIQVRILHPMTGQVRSKMFRTLAEAKDYAAQKKRHGWEVSISRVTAKPKRIPQRQDSAEVGIRNGTTVKAKGASD